MALENFGSLGVTVMLPFTTFSADVLTYDLDVTISKMDAELDRLGVSSETHERVKDTVENAYALSKQFALGDIDEETALSEISLAFVYAEVKRTSLETVMGLRGIVSYVLDYTLYTKPCEDDVTFEKMTNQVFEVSEKIGGSDSASAHPATTYAEQRTLH